MKKETVVKIIAIIIIPGGIPVYLGFKAFQLGKKIYNSNKKENQKDKDADNDSN